MYGAMDFSDIQREQLSAHEWSKTAVLLASLVVQHPTLMRLVFTFTLNFWILELLLVVHFYLNSVPVPSNALLISFNVSRQCTPILLLVMVQTWTTAGLFRTDNDKGFLTKNIQMYNRKRSDIYYQTQNQAYQKRMWTVRTLKTKSFSGIKGNPRTRWCPIRPP